MAEYNVRINKYNEGARDYDVLYPQTKAKNIIDTQGNKILTESDKGAVDGVAPLGPDQKVPLTNLPDISSVKYYEATITTKWASGPSGTKTQVLSIPEIKASQNGQLDHRWTGGSDYAGFVKAENQYLDYITNGFAETIDGGVKLTIFGTANNVNIPVIVEVS